jgi:hypothetical protein
MRHISHAERGHPAFNYANLADLYSSHSCLIMALLRNGAIMRPTEFSTDPIIKLLRKQQIATLPQLMAAVGTGARRTVFRKLAQLSYRTSYSHRGAY